MQLFCFLCVLFATPWCLGKCFGQTDSSLCNSSGELPAPFFFLNETFLFREGDWVTLRCMHSSDFSKAYFFFCKDGHLLSQAKPVLRDGVHTLSFQVSQHSGGQYSCGYEQLDKYSHKKKSLSRSRSLSVMTGHIDQSRCKEASCPVPIQPIVVGIVEFTILFLVSLLFCLVKKAEFHQRSLREEDPAKAIGDKASNELQYSEIVRFSTNKSLLSEDTEEIYVAMAGKKPNNNIIPDLEITDVSHEDVLE
ncbi:hypothetical protein JRQ81_005569 [Phrynocephalus forsythii]|uniref:Ig-like domain-containing protein n=1 Tax=Phrynocephalus forsythii TaxID=171643 RepID=A0A9Q0XGH1_9SAUR|nr:hypothetical protein JRQ81_005569 [Phrynocephalus forsythii]